MLFNLVNRLSDWLDGIGLYPFVQVLNQLEFRAFVAVILSFALVIIFGKRIIRWLVSQKISDSPEFYNEDLNRLMESRAHTPTMGGLII